MNYYAINTDPYLQHFGVKGMKWGVRRYENPDGTLTEEGKRRYEKGYNYGDVNIRRAKKYNKDDPDTLVVSNKNKKVEVSQESLRSMERKIDQEILSVLSSSNNMSVKKLVKNLDKNPEQAKKVHDIYNQYMNESLTSLLNSQGKDKYKQTVANKPKYSPEQAINKTYSALEKKYPNFNKLSVEKQDELFFEYASSSGLYKYM